MGSGEEILSTALNFIEVVYDGFLPQLITSIDAFVESTFTLRLKRCDEELPLNFKVYVPAV